jgi:TonB family protein
LYDGVDDGPLEERIELITEQKSQGPGVTIAIVASVVLHVLLVLYVVHNYHPITNADKSAPIARYVELIRSAPQRDFTEAPGPRVDKAPLTAPWSDANRKASTPHPTGTTPTTRPGDGSSVYVPPATSGKSRGERSGDAQQQQQPQQQQQAQSSAAPSADAQTAATAPTQPSTDQKPGFIYHPAQTLPGGAVDWNNAIKKVASLGGGGGGDEPNIRNMQGGEKGYAENGPISFESQWYDWGEYAASMVARIRVNWEHQMPELLRTGLKGTVTIRFTIHRDGHITDVTILSTSTIPPYDFAAKKAIELSSPLNPLPQDFPQDTERVTAGFYYNMEVPSSKR